MTGNPKWTGIVTGIRVDPSENGVQGTNKDSIGIDYIRVLPVEPILIADSGTPVLTLPTSCTPGKNTINTGEAVTFSLLTSGGRTPYQYDWSDDAGFMTSGSPQISTTYSAPGLHTICMVAGEKPGSMCVWGWGFS